MKEQFGGYYRPDEEELDKLWTDSLIVLDANILLNLYRYSKKTCDEFLGTLEKFSDRLWIPNEVAYEYHKNRPVVISQQKMAYQGIISLLKSNENKISGQISDYSHHPFIDVEKIREQIRQTYLEITNDLAKTETEHPDLDSGDPILDKITVLFKGKVGLKYSPERLQEIINEGKIRYDLKIPPGFADRDKKTDPDPYGDLILWYQIIDQAKLIQKPIIFVTDDKKDDWWRKIKEKSIGPRPELIDELKEKSGVSFEMYNSEKFLLDAKEHLQQQVNQSTIVEIQDVRTEELIVEAKRDQSVRIEANRDSFIIGRSVTFAGHAYTGEGSVRLVVFGPGQFAEGIEIATPGISRSYSWIYTWNPGFDIAPGHYTVRVYDSQKRMSDEVTVTAQKGAITIVAQGAQSYFIGEEIKISGTSTASYNVYLTIVGPEPIHEARKLDLFSRSKTGDEISFVRVDIMGDNTWSYVWDTSSVGPSLKAGIYTIYAIEKPITPDNIGEMVFGTVSIIIKKPFVSATVSQTSFAKGDTLYITGTAEGMSRQKLQLWIFGDSFFYHDTIRSNADSSFMIKLASNITKTLLEGQYYAIIQHPMMNNEFDVFPDDKKTNILINIPKKATRLFSLNESDGFRGQKAAEELIRAINSPDIDDICTQLMFTIVKPEINFDPIGTKHVGDKFTISAQTTLAVDDEIKVAVFPSTERSDQKNSGQFSGATGVIKVVKGNSGLNKIAFDIDTSGFKSDEYVVTASAILLDAVGERKFRII
ncbi:MAG: PIN domain-containing protein [Methanoregula sp.]|jgi:hypothetical protein